MQTSPFSLMAVGVKPSFMKGWVIGCVHLNCWHIREQSPIFVL